MPRMSLRLLSLMLLMTAAPAATLVAGPGVGPIGPRPAGPVELFEVLPDATLRVRAEAVADLQQRTGGVLLRDVPLDGSRSVDLRVERFRICGADTRFVSGRPGGDDLPLAFDAESIVLLRGRVVGAPASHVYLAIADDAARGRVELGPGAPSYALAAVAPNAKGMMPGPVAFVRTDGSFAPPLDAICGVVDPVQGGSGEGGAAGEPAGGSGPIVIRSVDLAVETDFEYYELFGDADAAAAYVVALFGAVTDIYLRDVHARFHLSFVRIWEEPEGLYDAPDPLGPFREHWNDQMQDVDRDVAQLLTGRRNLPYGGVAWLNALCPEVTSNGYSVSGYILGSFTDPTAPGSGNWDIVVAAHELGHNCGSLHTHSYDIDECASGTNQRGSIMSYCHTTTGGTANIDLRLNYGVPGQPPGESNPRDDIRDLLASRPCLVVDCNGNGIDDAADIAAFGGSADDNANGIPDECEDCNGNGVLDPEEIGSGQADDVNGNGRPDECDPDCNGNGTPDDLDISLGTSVDLYGDGIPDECDADCDGDGGSDYNQIQGAMSLDLDRNAVLDACQDCDDDGVSDFEALAGGLNLWVGLDSLSSLREFHATTGVPTRDSDELGASGPRDVRVGPDGLLYVSCAGDDSVKRVDPIDGTVVDDFVASGVGGLTDPAGLAFRSDGRLLVASRGNDRVLEFDTDGSWLGSFVPAGLGGLVEPHGLAFGPDANLYVSTGDDRVLRYDGESGALIDAFVEAGSGGLFAPRDLLFLPDGRLLVASFGSDAILAYDGASGVFLDQFDRGGLTSGFWALLQPWALRLSAQGDRVFVSSHAGNAAIHSYVASSGLFLRSFYVLSTNAAQPTGFDIAPPSPQDCNLNLLPDACDIARGTSADANGDGVPDECGPACPADLDGTGVVDVDDLVELILSWGACDGPCAADLDGNGQVDVDDLVQLILSWGPCG